MKTLHLVIITGIVFTLSYSLPVYASTDLQIRTDKINYFNPDKPVVTVSGEPNTTVELEITDPWGNIVFSHGIKILPTGNANYTLDISSYQQGVYSAEASMSTGHTTAKFSVGLTPIGGEISLNLVKYEYIPGDNIIILGAANSNSDVKLSLIEPNGTVVRSLQTFSDHTGHFSSFDFKIPYNAVFGKWQVEASVGLNNKSVDINVGSAQNNTIQTPSYSGPQMTLTTHVDSPLKQFKSGVTTQNITCKQGFVLAIKKQGHQPACIDPDTVPKLVLRGWSENPLNELLLRYGNQTQANLVFYDIMNEPKIRDWSMKGWRYSDYSYASNGDTHQSSATIHLYLPSNIGKHECENGSYGLVVINLKPVGIEHNYTETGCEIDTTTASVDPESNGR